jgi:hypothetical protein
MEHTSGKTQQSDVSPQNSEPDILPSGFGTLRLCIISKTTKS